MPDAKAKEHARFLRYFWNEKGDVERYCHAAKALALNPEVAKALGKLKKAQARMQRAIDALDAGDDE